MAERTRRRPRSLPVSSQAKKDGPVATPGRAAGRLQAAFEKGRPALICYLPLGDPLAGAGLADLYAECGVDILEIGVPGGDPYLDGKTITDSVRRARSAGLNSKKAAELIRVEREAHPDIGMVWMTYPPDDPTGLVDAVVASGVDGFLVPPGARAYAALGRELEARGVEFIHFLTHNPTLRDVRAAVASSGGYVMLQANPGPTGLKPVVLPDNAEMIGMLRMLGLQTPIALGIGIGNPEQARQAAEMGADGVIIGSLTVETLLRSRRELRELLVSLREAINGR